MEYAENKLTERVKYPQAENELKHRTAEDRNLHSHKTSYKTNDSGEKAGHKRTPLKRKPVLEELIKPKCKEIGKKGNYNNGEIAENGLKQSKPSQISSTPF